MVPVSFRESFRDEAGENQRDGLSRRSDQLAEQLVLRGTERDATVVRREHPRVCELDERRNQSLFDAQRRQLAQLFEKRRSLIDHLTDEHERLLRLFADEFSESRAAEMKRVGFFVGARIGRIARVRAETFPAERLALARECWDERTSGLHPTAENDSPAEDDEHSVRIAHRADRRRIRRARSPWRRTRLRHPPRRPAVACLAVFIPASSNVIARVQQTDVMMSAIVRSVWTRRVFGACFEQQPPPPHARFSSRGRSPPDSNGGDHRQRRCACGCTGDAGAARARVSASRIYGCGSGQLGRRAGRRGDGAPTRRRESKGPAVMCVCPFVRSRLLAAGTGPRAVPRLARVTAGRYGAVPPSGRTASMACTSRTSARCPSADDHEHRRAPNA